jgi:translation initiation factor 2A
VELRFSPKGKFLLTWERPKRDEASGNFFPNLKVWDTETGQNLESFLQKSQPGGWSLQYTYDEKYCARQVSSTLILFYESSNMKTAWSKLQVDGVEEFSLSPGQNYSVAVFVPESKGKPASVRVFQIPNFQQPVCQKTFFKADKVTMKWNKLGTALLVLASTEVDQSGKSYYGETNLYLLGIAGSYDSRVALDREGTIHDFNWSPNSREFGVVYGYMPAKTTIFDARGNEVHSLPLAPRNTILFSPHARFIIVAGFGNLQGSMDIFDRQRQFAKVATIEAWNTSVCEWSPDGQYIMTATTSPRLRVDNGVKIWHYTGSLIFQKEHDELFAASWRPQDVGLFPLKSILSIAPKPHPSAEHVEVKKAVNNKAAGAYRPPHARTAGVSAPTPLFQRAMANNDSATSVAGSSVPGAIPGSAPGAAPPGLSKSAAKNKKKRENKKVRDDDESDPNASSNSKQIASHPGSPPTANDIGKNVNQSGSVGPEDKKIRSLLKKLRAIEELKQRQAKGEKLEDTQTQKINTENSVRKELTNLGWQD